MIEEFALPKRRFQRERRQYRLSAPLFDAANEMGEWNGFTFSAFSAEEMCVIGHDYVAPDGPTVTRGRCHKFGHQRRGGDGTGKDTSAAVSCDSDEIDRRVDPHLI